MTSKQIAPNEIPQGREWANCNVCGKYRPLSPINLGRRWTAFACDECLNEDDSERWYREWASHE